MCSPKGADPFFKKKGWRNVIRQAAAILFSGIGLLLFIFAGAKRPEAVSPGSLAQHFTERFAQPSLAHTVSGDKPKIRPAAKGLFFQPPSAAANRYYFSGAAGKASSPPPVAIQLTQKYWRPTLFDDFRGKPGPANVPDYCYDGLKPQCHIWPGSESYDCDLLGTERNAFPPALPNLAAAVTTLDPLTDWAKEPLAAVSARYGQLVNDNLRHLNKCTWSIYNMANWMSTYIHDDLNHYSARFDPTQVKVDPTGKGHLELTAQYAPLRYDYDCIYGGTKAGPNCQRFAFATNQISTSVTYWVDPDPRWAGVYYAPSIPNVCQNGDALAGGNCQVKGFDQGILEETDVAYWVDANPAWPGVYYATNTSYRCKENIDYLPDSTARFRNLTCPILNGGIMSSEFKVIDPETGEPYPKYIDPQTGKPVKRGFMQQEGRFEVKLRVPNDQHSFPAAWMMPTACCWPYKAGEIDLLEARDDAKEVWQTYHHGKCYDKNGQEIEGVESPDACHKIPGYSFHMWRGSTVSGEFSKRDHVFAVEWSAQRLDFFVNNVLTGSVAAGDDPMREMVPTSEVDEPFTPKKPKFLPSNFPASAFYWILNHSTYVWPSSQSGFPKQTHRIDWVRDYSSCTTNLDFCPCGGQFVENVGCVLGTNEALLCPQEEPKPTLAGNIYQSQCVVVRHDCIEGGSVAGLNCQVQGFQNPQVIKGINYWVDTNPQWPGVYYASIGGQCPYGGSFADNNCQLISYAQDFVKTGVNYWVDTNPQWPGVYYAPISNTTIPCPHGGSHDGAHCKIASFTVPPVYVVQGVNYWVDTNPQWPGVYYASIGGKCPHGGSFADQNCQLVSYAQDFVETGVNYWVDTNPRWPGVYYAPDFR